jgi:hypothetical protein
MAYFRSAVRLSYLGVVLAASAQAQTITNGSASQAQVPAVVQQAVTAYKENAAIRNERDQQVQSLQPMPGAMQRNSKRVYFDPHSSAPDAATELDKNTLVDKVY